MGGQTGQHFPDQGRVLELASESGMIASCSFQSDGSWEISTIKRFGPGGGEWRFRAPYVFRGRFLYQFGFENMSLSVIDFNT